uniref:Helitron helicase-like domain-containing protein n=1 Tax=Lactuca sativa TaxID=4236 RepID=A0A9R1WXS2_LACSA|nr:hypothetical protein LSAT_V11C800454750 [Lactuca sativa]
MSSRDVPDLHDYKIVQDQRVYNKPPMSQAAAIWVESEDNEEYGPRDIEVQMHSDQSKSTQYFYGCYDPLQYPLMFPFGELGYLKKRFDDYSGYSLVSTLAKIIAPGTIANAESLLQMEEKVLGKNAESSKFVSVREYYAYKLQIRPHDKSFLLYFGRLLQQTHQEEIRQEFRQGIVDAMASGETEGSAVSKRIVFPANFIGGPRNMRKKYVDAMELVQKFGKPDIFLTQNLRVQEEAQNRADLVVRVFHAKLEQLKHEVFKNHIFGDVVAYTYVIEFQKRGLPHAHFLIILKPNFKMYTTEDYDRIVSAERPDKSVNPHLYRMVVKHMLHGPCGLLNPSNVCMKKKVSVKICIQNFFSTETSQTDDAYPIYRRRENGSKVKVRGAILDNRWVIPYNAYLLYRFDYHINIEICSTIKVVIE